MFVGQSDSNTATDADANTTSPVVRVLPTVLRPGDGNADAHRDPAADYHAQSHAATDGQSDAGAERDAPAGLVCLVSAVLPVGRGGGDIIGWRERRTCGRAPAR